MRTYILLTVGGYCSSTVPCQKVLIWTSRVVSSMQMGWPKWSDDECISAWFMPPARGRVELKVWQV